MELTKNPYGSPSSEASTDSAHKSATGSPLKPKPTGSFVSSLESSSCFAQIAILKHQIVELEKEKASLEKLAAEANERANDASKRAAAAEAETVAAKQRAQNRYTEKLHANNEVRHLRKAIEERDARRRGYMIQVENCFNSLKAEIMQLERAKEDQNKQHSAIVEGLESQLNMLQVGFTASQNAITGSRTESDNIIKDLKTVIVGQRTSREAAEKAQTAMEDNMKKMQDKMDEHTKESKEKELSLKKSLQELKKADSTWRLQVKDLQGQLSALDDQAKTARKQTQAAQEEVKAYRRQVQTFQQNLNVTKQQTEKTEKRAEAAERELAKAKQQFLMAMGTIRVDPPFKIQRQRQRQQQPLPQVLQQSQLQQQGNLQQQIYNRNKKRKTSPNENSAFNTNAFQPMRAQAFVPSPAVTTQNAPRGSNGVSTMANTPSYMKQPLRMVPNVGQGPFIPPRSNVSTGSAVSVQKIQHPISSQFPASYVQQGVLPAQFQCRSQQSPYRTPQQHASVRLQQSLFQPRLQTSSYQPSPQQPASMGSQQSPYQPPQQQTQYPQGASLNNTVSIPQHSPPKQQDPLLELDLDLLNQTLQNPAPTPMDPLLTNNVPQANSTDTTFVPNVQDNDALFNLGDGLMANPDTTGPQHDDLFSDDIWELFENPSETTVQDQAQNGM